jgi:hypothetical protein
MRNHSLAAGLLYLLTFISSIPAVFLMDPLLNRPDFILGAGSVSGVTFGVFLDFVNALGCIGCAVALFPVVRKVNEGFALGYVLTRTAEALIVMIGVVCLFAVITLRQEGLQGSDPATMTAIGRALVGVRDWTFQFGPALIPGFNALFLATLVYKARLVPRIIPALGLIGCPLLIASALGVVLGVNDTVSVFSGIATVPIFAWELLLGLWLAIVGFNRNSPIFAPAAPESPATTNATAPTLATSAGAA